jgi:RNA polymerase sigma factor (sigma-70 family)
MNGSQKLITEYVQNRSETAFRELVTRYLDLVYSSALRLVDGNAQLAQDVSQTVFADFARKAATLPRDLMLGGWLHRHTCFVAAKMMRGERRRQMRERQAAEMNALQDTTESEFSKLAPILDDAINELAEPDRTAILLRFFEQHDFAKIGEAIGTTDDAARMRVNRALEKLELLLKDRGITSTTAALSLALTAGAVHAAPIGMAACISTAALAGAALPLSTAITAAKTIAMTTLQKTLIAATLIALGGAGIYEARQNAVLRDHNQSLQQQQASLTERLQQMELQRDAASKNSAALAQELAQLKNNSTELLQLRAEVARLRQAAPTETQIPGSVETTAREWLRQVDLIKAKFEAWPDKKIPELAFLSDYDWLLRAREIHVESLNETTCRHMLAELRLSAKSHFAHSLGSALQRYIAEHDGNLPTQLAELNSYYEVYSERPAQLAPGILERYQLLQSGNLANLKQDEILIEEKVAPADAEYDTHFQFTAYGYRYEGIGKSPDLGPGSGTFRYPDKVLKYRNK